MSEKLQVLANLKVEQAAGLLHEPASDGLTYEERRELPLIAAQLLASNIMRGENIASYMKTSAGTLLNVVKDDRLMIALRIAKRLMELSREI